MERLRDKRDVGKIDPPPFGLSRETNVEMGFVSLCDRSIGRGRGR
jgi:hypothetical protein